MQPGIVFAHSPIKGMSHFYGGLLHPVFVPAHLLLLVAAGLFYGQLDPNKNKQALLAFVVATLAGLGVAWFSLAVPIETVILCCAAVTGILVTLKMAVSSYWCSLVLALAGFLVGMDSAQESLPGRDRMISLIGSSIGIFLLVIYAMGLADYCNKRAWQQIGVRVIGSWIAASALLVLALVFSTKR